LIEVEDAPLNPELTRSMVPNLRTLWPQVLVAGVLPVIGYALLRPHVSTDAEALAIVMVFPVIEIVAERLWRGRFEPIGIIALVSIGLGIVGAVALNGDAILLKVRESIVTGIFGLVCLVSLAASRPAMFHLGRAFATGGDPDKTVEFDGHWKLPGVATRFKIVTAVWGAVLVGEAILRTVMAVTLPTQAFLVISLVVFWAVIASLLWFTIAYSRAGEREVAATVMAGIDAGAVGGSP
jgi:hypothetical protein